MAITVWHSIRHNRNHMLHAEFTALSFIELDFIPIKVLHCGNNEFCPFCPCDLDLDPTIFIYDLDPYPLEIYPQTKNKLSTS